MKKVAVVVSILVLAIASVGLAQPRGADCPRGGDGPGFGAGHMMGGPGCNMHQGRHGGMRGGMQGGQGIQMILRHGDDLKLTDQQKEKLEGMIADFQTERIDAQAAMQKAQVELKDLMRREAPESDVMSGIDKVSRLRAEMQKMQYRHHQQVKGVLTDEQVEQLKDLRKNFGERMFQRGNDDDYNSSSPGRPGRMGGRG